MAKQGFYGPEYVRDKNGDYDYLGQVNRLHNLKQWDRQAEPIGNPDAPISLDELNERFNAEGWLIADDKHWQSRVLDKVAVKNNKRRRYNKHIQKKFGSFGIDTAFFDDGVRFRAFVMVGRRKYIGTWLLSKDAAWSEVDYLKSELRNK